MTKPYPHATVTRIVGKPDVLRVEVLDPALSRYVLKGTYLVSKLDMALEHADRMATTVERIGV